MKYKVITYKLAEFDYGEVIKGEEDGLFEGQENGGILKHSRIVINPDWFELLPKWEVVESPIGGLCYVTDGEITIKKNKGSYFFALEKKQAEAIAKALNDLDKEVV